MQKKDDMMDREDRALGAFFDAARKQETGPSDALLARVLADAGDVANGFTNVSGAPSSTPTASRRSWIMDIFSGLGGLAGASVMTASVMLGAFVGYATPENVMSLSGLGLGTDISEDLAADMVEFSTADFSLYESDILP